MWRNGLAALAAVHAVEWRTACPFLDDGSGRAPGLDQYLDWVQRWHRWAAQSRQVPLLDIAMEHLLARRPDAATVCVAWGDARPGNMIYDDDMNVAAVLDWEMASLGPPELDLGWWLFMDRFYSTGFGLARLDGLPTRTETVAQYEELSGHRVRDLEYYELLAALRMSIVVSRSTTSHVQSGLLDANTTMDSANPATQVVAELLGLPVPALSPDFEQVIRSVTRASAKSAP